MQTVSRASLSSAHRISVALCTYDGEAFLSQQLASMANQTRLPDEVVICDDGSGDRTIAIVREFAAAAPFPVKVIENQKNLGSTRNFEQAIRACSGDLIALSDQDDVWQPNRLERAERELAAYPEAGLVFSEGSIIDQQGRLVRPRMWSTFGFTPRLRRRLLAGRYDLCVTHRFVTGATVMFRANLRARCLPVGPDWIHDEWIAAAVAVFADLRAIDEPLISYRKHDYQQLGPDVDGTLQKKKRLWTLRLDALGSDEGAKKQWHLLRTQVQALEALCNFLSGMNLDERGESRLAAYRRYLQFLRFRSALPSGRLARLACIAGRLPTYFEYGRLAATVKDLLLSRS